MPPPAGAEVATFQLTGLAGVGLVLGDDEGWAEDDEPSAGGELAGVEEQLAEAKVRTTRPAIRYPRGTPLTVSS
jgi:hypothetical protein